MQVKKRLVAAAVAGFTIGVVHAGAQGAPQNPPPLQAPQPQPQAGQPQGDAPGPVGRGQGRGSGRGQQAVFPAQQRPPGDPALIARGKTLYSVTCTSCHGADLRGGQLGGPNLLRSQVVLSDQSGELILPIVHGARADKGMPPQPLSDADVKAVAEYIHSVLATAQNQGAPPASDAPPPDAVVGHASAGQTFFAAKCGSCHSPTGDLRGIATKVPEGKALQNFWITGGAGGGRGGRGGPAPNTAPRTVTTASVTMPSGEKVTGPLVRLDDFLVSVRLPDGTIRTIRRNGAVPKVVINDPLAPHKALLPVLTDKDMHDVTAYLATLK